MKKCYYEVQWFNNGCWSLNNRFKTLEEAQEHVKSYINTIQKDLRIIYKVEQEIESIKYNK